MVVTVIFGRVQLQIFRNIIVPCFVTRMILRATKVFGKTGGKSADPDQMIRSGSTLFAIPAHSLERPLFDFFKIKSPKFSVNKNVCTHFGCSKIYDFCCNSVNTEEELRCVFDDI